MRYTKSVLVVCILVLMVLLFVTTNNLRLSENEYAAFEALHNETMSELNQAKINYGDISFEKKQLEEQLDELGKKVNDYNYEVSANYYDLLERYSQNTTTLITSNDSTYKLLYWYDVINDEHEVFSSIVTDSLTIEEQANKIAEELSRLFFSGLSITTSVVEENNQKILEVNLSEDILFKPYNPSIEEVSWKTRYFQGSTGAMFTYVVLVDSFVQDQANGEWFDGVRFTYDDVTEVGFQHMGDFFDTTFLRESSAK